MSDAPLPPIPVLTPAQRLAGLAAAYKLKDGGAKPISFIADPEAYVEAIGLAVLRAADP